MSLARAPGRWDSFGARLYYLLGILYYVYHGMLILGGSGVVLSVAAIFVKSPYWAAASFLPTSICVLAMGIVLWAKQRNASLGDHNPGLKEQKLESTYHVLDGHHYTYTRRVIVEAQYDGVDHYMHKFFWSGYGPIEPVGFAGCLAAEIERPRHGSYRTCKIQFERPLRKGEVLDFTYSISLADAEGSARPFLSHNVRLGVNQLSMRVKGIAARRYKRQIFTSMLSDIPIYEEDVLAEEHSPDLVWEIKHPRVGYRFELSW